MGMSSSAIGWQAVLKPRQPVTVGESINEKPVGQVSLLVQAEGTDTASEAEAVPLLRRALSCVCVLLLAVGLGYLFHSANPTAKSFRPWFDVLGILWVLVALMYMWRAIRDKRRRSAKTREHTTR